MHAKAEGEECICDLGWIRDPADSTSLCVCPDLCHDGSVTCPGETECYHVTCNIASCRCKDGLHYDPSSRTCLNTCQYYGDAVCGLTSRRYCIASGEEEATHLCLCMDGYELVDGVCRDIDECKGGPCKEREQCINTPGSNKCVCQSGYMRNRAGLCVNVNECASPSLHDCEHRCEDAEPPVGFTCSCYPGFTWQVFTRSCVIDDELTKCECEDGAKSVCYKPRDGEKQCHPRPGYVLVNGTYQDEAECESDERVDSWCSLNSECVEGEGSATCNCLNGYANDTLNYGQCEAIVCPTGTVLSESSCIEPCDSVKCAPPLRCTLTTDGVPECRCMSECQALLQPEVTTSVYRGVLEVLALSGDFVTELRVTKALGEFFGVDNTEILSVTPAANKPSANKRSDTTDSQTYNVEFLLMSPRANMSDEINRALRGQCINSTAVPSTCVLPGGLVVERESIAVEVKDPCEDSPCPQDVSECVPRDDVSGRYVCRCLKGYVKVNSFGSVGFCREVDECAEGLAMCTEDQECINTPGSFLCRSLTGSASSGDFHRDLAIAFGVLFFMTLFFVMCLVYRSAKRSPRVHECLPMNATAATGFENAAFHK
ncbi:fibrillin-1-like [Penaeus japonicus]|uniref:fibrillin-1-like n=1 Tax=Penaeus japonicus TaxID=27405 RepID=UPI001C7122C4|nr:fibrillin-1-like [Penaeus japonicus]